MRTVLVAIAAISLLGGCAASIRDQPVPGSELVPRGLVDLPAVSRPLADLAQGVEERVLLHHVDGEGRNTTWSTKLKMRTSFRLYMDCVEASGVMTVLVDQSRLPYQCSSRQTNVRIGTIPNGLLVRSIEVEVPRGAKWAILISDSPPN